MTVKYKQNDVDELITTLCTSVLHEMTLVSKIAFPKYTADLFMEQVAVCGMFSYKELFRPDWARTILSWQQPSGCYGYKTNEKASFSAFGRHRSKREDVGMGGKCRAHRSAVAVDALAVYIRYVQRLIH